MDSEPIAYIIFRWVIAAPFFFFAGTAIAFNLWIVWVEFIQKSDEHPSMAPLLGGVSGSLALFICPVEGSTQWLWVPFVIDPGSMFYFSWFFLGIILEKFTKDRSDQDNPPDQST